MSKGVCCGLSKGVCCGLCKGVCCGLRKGVCCGLSKGVCCGLRKGVCCGLSKGVCFLLRTLLLNEISVLQLSSLKLIFPADFCSPQHPVPTLGVVQHRKTVPRDSVPK